MQSSLKTPAAEAGERPAALDPRSLGRPLHLLPAVAEQMREALQRQVCLAWNRRYRADYQLRTLTLKPLDRRVGGTEGRWLRTLGPQGAVACRMERRLVTGLMARRLGLADASTPPEAAGTGSATEERLEQQLARRWIALCLQLIEQAAAQGGLDAAAPAATASEPALLQPSAHPGLGADAWLLQLCIADGLQGETHEVLLALDGSYLAPLLRHLADGARAARPPATAPLPLGRRLNLRLQARLLERELALGTVLDLAPGSLIPIRLADATVLVDESPLMRATVAEHQGKLCLTSFQDLE
ncbi:FliM/FliN family flagellar motor C-terminal domain-containing protein [Pelomonas sp. CA6]|uniref:FliM/FliN family flagellar motor switch protein n=1 Tax=Pelomonas sp. CA6 TaxID=2907999 RepID=UPI001F4C1C32|nr:FliM/FliN family flagellar motor C-terminal domain-containing protein [Pelomonas sp. CA6]MCH7345285.1 FliM/FliN family flagellar motor C-terminal domain-containing protein [Pelomonas sp. CA6]